MTIRVLVVDDQVMVRVGFRMILDSADGIEVVGEADNGARGVAEARRLTPDVVLMDVQMPEMDGLEATRAILADGLGARVVILTTFERDDYIYAAMGAGASGFLLKNAPPEDLIAAVRVVAAGDALLAPSVTRRVLEGFARRSVAARPRPAELARLSPRELEVLQLLATGASNAELAASLFIGEGTVKTHVSSVLNKLGLRDRVHAVVYAYENGVVQQS